MDRIVLLDSGIVGQLCVSPRDPKGWNQLRECQTWLSRVNLGSIVRIPEIVDFEVRRELIRIAAPARLARLDRLGLALGLIEVDLKVWRKAAEFWALVRRAGVPTSSPDALDADAILAAIAATLGDAGNPVTIATTNVRHLTRFPGVDARNWRDVS